MPFLRAQSLSLVRTFSTSHPRPAKSTKTRLLAEHAKVPPYPHGPSRWYKQSNFGLYGGARIRSGNNVSPKTATTTRRKWRPNIFEKRLFSESLDRNVRIRVSTRVLRTIDKVGGLDEYLLGEKSARIKELGMAGWKLRWRIMQTPMVRKRFQLQREAMGLLPGHAGSALDRRETEGLMTSDGRQATEEQMQEEVLAIDRELDNMDAREEMEGESQRDGEAIESQDTRYMPPRTELPYEQATIS